MPPDAQPPDNSGGMLSAILIKQTEMATDVALIKQQVMEKLPDHENRIRKLEAWRYGLPLSGLMSVGALVTAVYELVRH